NGSPFDARVERFRIASPVARVAFAELVPAIAPALGGDVAAVASDATPSDIFAEEREILGTYRVIPVVQVPRIYGVGSRVRNWEIRAGDSLAGWQLADLWVEGEAP